MIRPAFLPRQLAFGGELILPASSSASEGPEQTLALQGSSAKVDLVGMEYLGMA
jgi:hypothetical protein